MWPFKNTRKLARPDEFPAVIDAIWANLRSEGCTGEADRPVIWFYEMVWTTPNELSALRLLLLSQSTSAANEIRKERRDLPPDIAAEIRRLIKSVDHICTGDESAKVLIDQIRN